MIVDLMKRVKIVVAVNQTLLEFCQNAENKKIEHLYEYINSKLSADLEPSNSNVQEVLFDCENVEKFKSLRDLVVRKLCEK